MPLSATAETKRLQPVENIDGASRFDAILDAAEQVFASSGYKGATMREIAETAQVAQGLIHYHFKNKETLFEKMVARRSGEINDRRAELLAALFQQNERPELAHIVDTLFRPTIENGLKPDAEGGAFARVLMTCYASPDPHIQKLTEKYYNPIAQIYIDALMRAEPELTRADAVWGYTFAIGVVMTMMSKTGRPARLSDGICDDSNADELLKRIVPFVCGGIRALL